jgi:hypothetical protein
LLLFSDVAITPLATYAVSMISFDIATPCCRHFADAIFDYAAAAMMPPLILRRRFYARYAARHYAIADASYADIFTIY